MRNPIYTFVAELYRDYNQERQDRSPSRLEDDRGKQPDRKPGIGAREFVRRGTPFHDPAEGMFIARRKRYALEAYPADDARAEPECEVDDIVLSRRSLSSETKRAPALR